MPAGSFEKLKFALAYGADAVYAGVPRYSLRTRENDFRKDSIREAISYTHDLGRKLYLTMNIYAHNTKVKGFLRELESVLAFEPDGVIMTDPGLIHMALREFPELVVHLSTQANSTNWTSVAFWRDMGIKRIILSRELSIREIAEIHDKVPDIELEAFVHGAICIAYSGRCLITNYLNHRDANQGTCTNSCRWNYIFGNEQPSLLALEADLPEESGLRTDTEGYYLEEPKRPGEHYPLHEDEHGTYLMNAKDLCAVELLQELMEAGVVSFKIEGRTKSAYYAAMTARSYRASIDDVLAGRPFNPENLKDLIGIAHRGYITGFYTRDPRSYGENYHEPSSQDYTHQNAGLVTGWAEGWLEFDVKNRIDAGDELSLISPDGVQSFQAKEMLDRNQEKAVVLHGGNGLGYLPWPKDPGPYSLLRKTLRKTEQPNPLINESPDQQIR